MINQDSKSLGSTLQFYTFILIEIVAIYIIARVIVGRVFFDGMESLSLGLILSLLFILQIVGHRLNPSPQFASWRVIQSLSHVTTVTLIEVLTFVPLLLSFILISPRVPTLTSFNLLLLGLLGFVTALVYCAHDGTLKRGVFGRGYYLRFAFMLFSMNVVMLVQLFWIP